MSIYEFTVKKIDGNMEQLEAFRGKVLLIVNTASKCGYTVQFEGLQKLYEKHHDQGFEILGFPSSQFFQEFNDAEKISSFCSLNYGVTFPMFAKIDVNGGNADPLYKHLKKAAPGFLGSEAIKWNFTKFLVDRDGNVVKRYGSADTPAKIAKDVEQLL